MRNLSAKPTMRNTIEPSSGQMKRPVVQRLGSDSRSIDDAHGSVSKILQVAVFGDVAPLVGRKLREWAPDIRCFVGFGGLEAVLASQVPRPDIVVVLPLGGAQAAAVVIARRRWPEAKVLVISSKDRVAGLSRAGAHGSYVGGLGSLLAVDSDLADQVRLLAGANRPRRYQREFEADLPAYRPLNCLLPRS